MRIANFGSEFDYGSRFVGQFKTGCESCDNFDLIEPMSDSKNGLLAVWMTHLRCPSPQSRATCRPGRPLAGRVSMPGHAPLVLAALPWPSASLSLHIVGEFVGESGPDRRRGTLVQVKVKFTVKFAVCESLRMTASCESDCEIDFDSPEGSCSLKKSQAPSQICHTLLI